MPSKKTTRTKKHTKSPSGSMMVYCVKCKKKVSCSGLQRQTLKNGRCRMHGKCPKCSTKVGIFVKC